MTLTQRDRRAMWVALIALVAALATRAGRAVSQPPAGETDRTLAMTRTLVRSLPRLRDSLRHRDSLWTALSARIISSRSPNTAAAELSAYVVQAARDRVELSSVQVLNDSIGAGLVRLRLSVSGRADVIGLMQFTAAVESGVRMVRFTRISVTQPDVTARTDVPEGLNIDFVVEALIHIST